MILNRISELKWVLPKSSGLKVSYIAKDLHSQSAGGNVYGTFLDGTDMYAKELNPGHDSPSVIVIGNESNGISDDVAGLVSDRL